MLEEYGGYLPLELNNGKEFYCFDKDKMQAYNSGRAAIYYALKNLMPSKIYIPYYICDTVVEVAKKINIPIERYYLDQNFLPLDLNPNENECVILVNYFGIMSENVLKNISKYDKVIIDNTQAFFKEPIFEKNVINIYSCRKFIGVSDGAYLIGQGLKQFKQQEVKSSENALHLLKSIEYGTNYAYMENKQNESYISQSRGRMSLLTRRILKNADYSNIKKKRIENYNLLVKIFKDINKINLKPTNREVPYIYPLLFEGELKKKLINRKIYVPTLWVELLDEEFNGTNEQYWAKYLLPLPIDQRYTMTNIEKMSSIIFEEIRSLY